MKKNRFNIIAFLLMLTGAACAQKQITVAKTGRANFRTIQAAINSLTADAKEQRVICIKKGVYKEKLFIDKNFITLKGESPKNTIVTIALARDEWRCNNADDYGTATINLKGSDIRIENLSVINSYGKDFTKEKTIKCANDSSGIKVIRPGSHQMALRTFTTTRLFVKNCTFLAFGGDTVSPWNTDDGMFYFKDCVMEGGVDFYCPRGWALADNCTFICHNTEAAIWHDGSKNKNSKTVFMNCRFKGDDGFKLGRYHRDAQFYLFNCSFPSNMADADIYQRIATPPNVIQWGKRVFYYNCHKEGGDYNWHKNNLPEGLGINDITAAWAYDYKWYPVPEKKVIDVDTIIPAKNAYDTVAENMLLYQRANGGWPKQFQKEKVDYKKILNATELKELGEGFAQSMDATIDNNATTRETRYLAKIFKKYGDKRFLDAAEKGVSFLLKAQLGNGGWPQYYPDFSGYRGEITYNDNAMVNVLNLLTDIVEGAADLDIINESFVKPAADAVKRGIICIYNTQVKQGDKLTAWCAQHDPVTLKPEKARAYELPSLSGQETVGILRFLMRFDNPGTEMKNAIIAGIEWLEKVKISGYKYTDIAAPALPGGKDRVLVPDAAGIVWARFYDLETNEPFFCGRDGQRKKTLAEVELERRIGYAWYNTSPLKLLNDEYPKWKAKYLPAGQAGSK